MPALPTSLIESFMRDFKWKPLRKIDFTFLTFRNDEGIKCPLFELTMSLVNLWQDWLTSQPLGRKQYGTWYSFQTALTKRLMNLWTKMHKCKV